MIERRRYVRIPESSQISYEVMPSIKIKDNITKDISEGGIRFFVDEFIPKNSLLKIRLTIEKITFSFEAVVKLIWIREVPRTDRYEIGVEFINMPKKATEYFIDYIKTSLGLENR